MEQEYFRKRLEELAAQSYSTNRFIFTDFLSEAEQSDALMLTEELRAAGLTFYGGYDEATRRMLRFGDPDALGYEEPFPIRIVQIEPLQRKFADTFTHRDYLGAILNLGIDRKVTGDILTDGTTGYLFCEETIAPFILENLQKVKHTNVRCALADEVPDNLKPVLVPTEIQISSERADAVIAHICNLSRSEAQDLFRQQHVFINGRAAAHPDDTPKPGDTISVRGHGRWRYDGPVRNTRKGKICVQVSKYQ